MRPRLRRPPELDQRHASRRLRVRAPRIEPHRRAVAGRGGGEIATRRQLIPFLLEPRGHQQVAIGPRRLVRRHDRQRLIVASNRLVAPPRLRERRPEVVERHVVARIDLHGASPQRNRIAPVIRLPPRKRAQRPDDCDADGYETQQPRKTYPPSHPPYPPHLPYPPWRATERPSHDCSEGDDERYTRR